LKSDFNSHRNTENTEPCMQYKYAGRQLSQHNILWFDVHCLTRQFWEKEKRR